jgi:4-hydroxymandelate oxidase
MGGKSDQTESVADERDLLTIADYEARAREVLPRPLFDVLFGWFGAPGFEGNTHSMEALAATRLRPRVMAGVEHRKLATTVLGEPISFPVLIAPAGYHQRSHPEGELATARAAAAAGTVFTVSTASTYSIEEVRDVSDGALWFQLYFFRDRAINRHLMERAEAAGYRALMITVDSLGRSRERETRFDFTRHTEHRTIRTIDPARVLRNFQQIDATYLSDGVNYHMNFDRAFTWDDLAWVRSVTSLPIVIKGVQTAEDAALARAHGVDAVVVSNHGGHALPDSRGTLEALPEVVEAVGSDLEVYVDGGFRRGPDVLKALAVGARAVLIGRPVFWGLAIDGEQGVRDVLGIYRDELDGAMTLCGVTDVEQVDPALVVLPPSGRRPTTGTAVAAQLLVLAELMDRGRLSDGEYRRAKEAVLDGYRTGVIA